MGNIVLIISALCLSCLGYAQGEVRLLNENTLICTPVQIAARPMHQMSEFNQEFKARFNIPQRVIDDVKQEHLQMIISFAVALDGMVSNIKLVRSQGEDVEREALRVMMEMPKWMPAIKGDEYVSSRFVLPMTLRRSELPEKWKTLGDTKGRGFVNVPAILDGEDNFRERFMTAVKSLPSYNPNTDVTLEMKINIGKEGELMDVVLLNSRGIKGIVIADLKKIISSISRWLPARVNNRTVADEVSVRIVINASNN